MVTDQYIDTSVWNDIRSKLVSGLSGVSVNASYNSRSSRPQLVINPIVINEGFNKFGGKEGRKAINVVITCYGKGSEVMDSLASEVSWLLKDNDIDGIDLIDYNSDWGVDTVNGNKYFGKVLSFNYLRE